MNIEVSDSFRRPSERAGLRLRVIDYLPRASGRAIRPRARTRDVGAFSGPDHRALDMVSAALVTMLLRKEDVAMATFDLGPLWWSTVGFDRLFDLIEHSVRRTNGDNYPLYNVERTGEDHTPRLLASAS